MTMTPEQLEEFPEPVLWYVSFASATDFLGAVVLESHGIVHAITRCHQLGLNPGGEAQAILVPPGHENDFPHERLLTKEEVNPV